MIYNWSLKKLTWSLFEDPESSRRLIYSNSAGVFTKSVIIRTFRQAVSIRHREEHVADTSDRLSVNQSVS